MTASPPLTAIEQRLVATVAARRDQLLADLATFVNIPTGRSPHPAAIEGLSRTREMMRERLVALGASAQLIAGQPRPHWLDGPACFRGPREEPPIPATLVCRKAGASSSQAVLLSGHLDTVHDPRPDAPFRTLSIAPDRKTATGPGVVDMKGGLVIALHALESLAECGIDVPFGFILNSDEETGSFHSDQALRAEAQRGYAAALALEPASGTNGLVTARGGSGQFMIEARGKAAHVGRDFASGRSATDLLARAITASHALTNTAEGRIVNISTLYCDQPPNQVADHAAAWGNLRYPTQAAGDALAAGLETVRANLTTTDLTLAISLIRPAKPSTPATMQLAETVRAAASTMGQELTFTSTAGVCDGNNLQAAAPTMPVLDTLGVRGGGLHTPQEWIELASLVDRCQLLALTMARLAC